MFQAGPSTITKTARACDRRQSAGYPYIAPPASATPYRCAWLSATERQRIEDFTQKFNGVIASATAAANVEFVTLGHLFAGHELCTSDSYLNDITAAGGQERGHPTAYGQRLIGETVARYLYP